MNRLSQNKMKFFIVISSVLLISALGFKTNSNSSISTESDIKNIWNSSSFKKDIAFEVFLPAMKGFYNYNFTKTDKIVIVDYTKPSTQKRFYIIDLKNKSLLNSELVAHGKNTGANLATEFSNKPESLKSSLGIFKTAETYHGKHGFSLRLDGLEPGKNDNARKRAIVIHGAKYVSKSFASKHGRLGRSWGCPALPVSKTKEIINKISGGTCLYIHGTKKSD